MRRHEPPDAHPRRLSRWTAFSGRSARSPISGWWARTPEIGRVGLRLRSSRVAKIGDKYYVTWCNGYHGPTIGIAWTDDFETFHQFENAFLPYNRNGVLFPRKIGGRFAMLSRPSDTGHTPFGDIFYSESPDMEFWGRHRHVMSPAAFEVSAWQCMKIGAGPVPIETRGGLAAALPRGAALVQRLCLRVRLGAAGPGGAVEGRSARSGPVPDFAARDVRAARATFRTSHSPARRSMTPKRAGSPSITDAPTPSRALRSAISLKLSTSRRKTTSYEKPCAACGSDAVSGSTGTRACGVCGSVHRDYELRDRRTRGRSRRTG